MYHDLIKQLFSISLFGGVKLGLSNCVRLDEQLGFPSKQFKSIHIAGSNGKGSVATKIAMGLQLAGYKVGLYTSPHISSFRERIRINGVMISEVDVEHYLSLLFALPATPAVPTFFEYTTFLAFQYFANEKVDFAVIETGLGGRLDATNIIYPVLGVITSISLDHMEILGFTIEAITREKAGIIKPNTPIVIGQHVPLKIIQEVAQPLKSPIIQVTGSFLNFDRENRAIASKALEMLNVPEAMVIKGLEAMPPCRTESVSYHGKTVILDVAHNPNGLQHLFEAIKKRFPKQALRIVVGLSKSKDIEGCVAILKAQGMHFHLVAATNDRALSVDDLDRSFQEHGVPEATISVHQSVADGVTTALNHDELIIVCGSFFIMNEARAALGVDEPRDFMDMQEVYSHL